MWWTYFIDLTMYSIQLSVNIESRGDSSMLINLQTYEKEEE